MFFLFLLGIAALVYLKMSGRVSISWWIILAIAIILMLVAGKITLPSFFRSLGANTSDPAELNACGCGPNQRTLVQHKNFWGKWQDAGAFPCNIALSKVSNGHRNRIVGCI